MAAQRPLPLLPSVHLHDEAAEQVFLFIKEHCNKPNVEIEAKLGLLFAHNTQARLDLGVMCVTPLRPGWFDRVYKFDSQLEVGIFKFFNDALNLRVTDPKRRGEVTHTHTRTTDRTYGDRKNRVRVSTDTVTKKQLACVNKQRIADLDIYCPRNCFDCRISASYERPVPRPTNMPCTGVRVKDRHSYRYRFLTVDITKVEAYKASPDGETQGPPSVTFEVELEVADMDALKAASQKPDGVELSSMTRAFWETLRSMVVAFRPGSHQPKPMPMPSNQNTPQQSRDRPPHDGGAARQLPPPPPAYSSAPNRPSSTPSPYSKTPSSATVSPYATNASSAPPPFPSSSPRSQNDAPSPRGIKRPKPDIQ